jgi:hypothetical protein
LPNFKVNIFGKVWIPASAGMIGCGDSFTPSEEAA